MLPLPQTTGCLVCGPNNPLGLKLNLLVEESSGIVRAEYTPGEYTIGFERVVHGGMIATVIDEAMVWAATWRMKRFCLCGELTVRFRQGAAPGQFLKIEAIVETSRPRLVETAGKIFDASGKLLITASGKYVPVSPEQHQAVTATFIDHPETQKAAALLRGGVA
ncbi:MAG TPA: PaaI family thioesterase [Tepidisphaeraceae bacterium]|jgi:acyl-coenzyme A thioesterase PaaI-like protein|nr:PaaI family thioesterase [Tepidisphaeraceae bacterium]